MQQVLSFAQRYLITRYVGKSYKEMRNELLPLWKTFDFFLPI